MYFFHSGKHKLENTDCQTKVKNPQSQEEDVTKSIDGMSDDEWEDNISKNLDFDQYSHENSITYEENNSKKDGGKSDYDWEDYFANEENRNGLINKPYIQGIIKAEVEKQLKELLKDKTSPRKYIPQPKWTWRERSAVE